MYYNVRCPMVCSTKVIAYVLAVLIKARLLGMSVSSDSIVAATVRKFARLPREKQLWRRLRDVDLLASF